MQSLPCTLSCAQSPVYLLQCIYVSAFVVAHFLLRNLCCVFFDVHSLLCIFVCSLLRSLCCATLVVQSLLCLPCCAFFAVHSSLCSLCCAFFVAHSLLCMLRSAVFVMHPSLHNSCWELFAVHFCLCIWFPCQAAVVAGHSLLPPGRKCHSQVFPKTPERDSRARQPRRLAALFVV